MALRDWLVETLCGCNVR